MVVNFRTCKISRDAHKLIRISSLIIIIKKKKVLLRFRSSHQLIPMSLLGAYFKVTLSNHLLATLFSSHRTSSQNKASASYYWLLLSQLLSHPLYFADSLYEESHLKFFSSPRLAALISLWHFLDLCFQVLSLSSYSINIAFPRSSTPSSS